MDIQALYVLLHDNHMLTVSFSDFSQEISKTRDAIAKGKIKAISDGTIALFEVVELCKFVMSTSPPRRLTEEEILKQLGRQENIAYKRVDASSIDLSVLSAFYAKSFALRNVVIPIEKRKEGLIFAVSHTNLKAMRRSLEELTHQKVAFVLCRKSTILSIVDKYWDFNKTIKQAEKKRSEIVGSTPNIGNLERLINLNPNRKMDENEEEVVRTVETIFHMAIEMGASDIHIEPKRETCLVRMRVDGILGNMASIPIAVHPSILARIKITAGLNIAEKRKPQDGRLKVAGNNGETEFRLSTLPTAFGEKLVIRIFDSDLTMTHPSTLGFTKADYVTYNSFINRPNGVIYITGPTGSGKTTTLYSTLKTLARDEVNIVTIEDPVEMVYDTFNQVSVNLKIDLTFAHALRAILRQDPDILMVGETRDFEGASSVMQAAITGHLVFSTLHTNDTPSAITRLTELGIEPYLISSAVVGVIAQRLVRKICEQCKVETQLTESQVDLLGSLGNRSVLPTVFRGSGCDACRNTGYVGRKAIFEILKVDRPLMEMVKAKSDSKELKEFAVKNGLRTLFVQGMDDVANGLTTVEEILRVIGGGDG